MQAATPPDERPGRRRFAVAFAAVLALVLPAAAAADATGPELIGYVNAMRVALGIPSGITENPGWSSACALHNHYDAINDVLTHSERASAPGFTSAGADAGAVSVLYRGSPWTTLHNPFEHAPIHLHQLLAPRLDVMGASENAGFGCATTIASRGRPAPRHNVTYTYPADGSTGWRVGEIAEELGRTTGERLGLARGAATGPYLYVLFDGPQIALRTPVRATRASLTGPAGRIDLLVADNTTPGLEPYLPVGAQLIPRHALAPETRYRVKISATVGTTPFTHRWSFTTGPSSPDSGSGRGDPPGDADEPELEPAALARVASDPAAARLMVSGPGVRPRRVTLPYARTSGSSSAYLPLASSVPASG